LDKLEKSGAKDLEFLHAFRKKRGERTLLFFEPGNVGVAEQSDAVGIERNDLIDRGGKTRWILMRKAVNQVHVDAVEAELARAENEISRKFVWLNAMNRFLYFRMKILNTHAKAIEAEAAQNFQMVAIRNARVHFNTEFGVGSKGKAVPRERKQLFDLLRSEIGWCATAPVELHDRTRAGNAKADAIDLLFQNIEIGGRDIL